MRNWKNFIMNFNNNDQRICLQQKDAITQLSNLQTMELIQ